MEEPIEKMRILEKLVQKFVPASQPFPPMKNENVEKTAVVKIVVESMSGKANVLSSSHKVLINRFHVQKQCDSQRAAVRRCKYISGIGPDPLNSPDPVNEEEQAL